MKYLMDIKEGEQVIDHYYCKQKQTLKSKAGKSYLSLKLQDKTAIVDAKVWDLNNDVQNFEENEFIKIDATALIYQNEIQLKIIKIRRSKEGEYDPTDYIPTTDKNIEEMYKALVSYIGQINHSFFRRLLENIFVHNTEIKNKFMKHSAAKTIHHGYLGGLIEHTLSVVEICAFMSSKYKFVSRDLLLTGAMLHDLGKIYELSDLPANDYTDEGQLLGHIILCSDMITEEAHKIEGFPKDALNLLKHCLISHHGAYEYGSPKLPKTIEAFILHCADNMDAKSKLFEEIIAGSNHSQGYWIGYQRLLERNIRKTNLSS